MTQKILGHYLPSLFGCGRVSFWQGRYGGYSGDLIPASAFDLLKKESNAVLVDIRPQA